MRRCRLMAGTARRGMRPYTAPARCPPRAACTSGAYDHAALTSARSTRTRSTRSRRRAGRRPPATRPLPSPIEPPLRTSSGEASSAGPADLRDRPRPGGGDAAGDPHRLRRHCSPLRRQRPSSSSRFGEARVRPSASRGPLTAQLGHRCARRAVPEPAAPGPSLERGSRAGRPAPTRKWWKAP